MRKSSVLICVALIFTAQFIGGYCQDEELEVEDVEDVEEEKAFLLTRKRIVDKEVVVGRNTTVEIEVHNAGTSSALEVEVDDVPWPANQFYPAGGSSSATFPRITAGSSAKFTYNIIPLTAGFIIARPAVVTYRETSDSTERQVDLNNEAQPLPVLAQPGPLNVPKCYASTDVSRSSVPHVYILTALQKYVKTAITVGSYASLGSLRTVSEWRNVGIIAALGGFAVVSHRGYKSLTDARKRTQYQRALEEVNKMK